MFCNSWQWLGSHFNIFHDFLKPRQFNILFTPLMIIMMRIMVTMTTMVITMTIVTMKVMMITFAVNNCTFYSVNYTDDGNFRN